MKNVAVLGGGPAGSFAAERLARSGIDTVVLDEKLAWEKPCGGGITYKAYHQYPFLLDNATPKKLVTKLVLSEPRAGSTRLELNDPLLIYSRHDLNKMLLDRAQNAASLPLAPFFGNFGVPQSATFVRDRTCLYNNSCVSLLEDRDEGFHPCLRCDDRHRGDWSCRA